MELFDALRNPAKKPEGQVRIDKRQDAVEKRLERVMTVEQARRAQRVLQAKGR